MRNQTIRYYNENAKDFCAGTIGADMSVCRDKFVTYLRKGAKILDAGCGSGRDSKVFLDMGFDVVAMDASIEVCKEAEGYLNRPVLCQTFEGMDFVDAFDGIWACASLLHVAKSEIDLVMEKMKRALKDRGMMYVSFKYGENEREKDGRFFSDYTEESLVRMLDRHDFQIEEIFVSCDVRKEREGERWVNAMVRKIA